MWSHKQKCPSENIYLAGVIIFENCNKTGILVCGATVDILIMHGLRLEPTWEIGIYACILISNNAHQPIHNLAGYALLDVLVPI